MKLDAVGVEFAHSEGRCFQLLATRVREKEEMSMIRKELDTFRLSESEWIESGRENLQTSMRLEDEIEMLKTECSALRSNLGNTRNSLGNSLGHDAGHTGYATSNTVNSTGHSIGNSVRNHFENSQNDNMRKNPSIPSSKYDPHHPNDLSNSLNRSNNGSDSGISSRLGPRSGIGSRSLTRSPGTCAYSCTSSVNPFIRFL